LEGPKPLVGWRGVILLNSARINYQLLFWLTPSFFLRGLIVPRVWRDGVMLSTKEADLILRLVICEKIEEK
jgi:hypothetical protein